MSLSLGRRETWKLGTSGMFWAGVPGAQCWAPSVLPPCSHLWCLGSRKGGLEAPRPNLILPGTSHPSWGCPKPHPALTPLTWGGSS